MEDFTTFLIAVFCFVDDWLKGKRLRQCGPKPTLSDSEVLTIEIMGAFLCSFAHLHDHYGGFARAGRARSS